MFRKKKDKLPAFMLLGQGGHREDGSEADDDRACIVFVVAEDMDAARHAVIEALEERDWHGVHLLRGGEVGECPAQEPYGTAWAEVRGGRRGVIVTAPARSAKG